MTMGTKTESPKLSPEERLARKRAAARLRQQRCRARKREAMLEKKRGDGTRQLPVKVMRDSSRPAVVVHPVHHHAQPRFPASKPMRSIESSVEPWVSVNGELTRRQHKFPSEPIYHCVSFDSQKSLEETQINKGRTSSTPPRSPSGKTSTVVTPSRSPSSMKTLVRVLSDEKLEEPLVPEEEAAVVAMLSLKSGPITPTEKSDDKSNRPGSPPREVVISQDSKIATSPGLGGVQSEQTSKDQLQPNHTVQPPQQLRMNPRLYEAYAYGAPMKLPPQHSRVAHHPPLGYYRVHPSVPPHPHYHRGYYPPAPRFVSYDYK